MQDFADMAGIECVVIDKDTNLNAFRNELRWNEVYYKMAQDFNRYLILLLYFNLSVFLL